MKRVPIRGRLVSPQAVRDLDSAPGHRPRIDPWLAARILAGMAPRAVVVASGGAITLRTAYRWKATLIRLEEVEIDGRSAIFAVRRGEAPARLTPWGPATHQDVAAAS